jgi:hypothetical protein
MSDMMDSMEPDPGFQARTPRNQNPLYTPQLAGKSIDALNGAYHRSGDQQAIVFELAHRMGVARGTDK